MTIDPLAALRRLAPTMKDRESLRAWAGAAGTSVQTLLRAIDGDDTIAIGTVRRLLEAAGWKAAAVPSAVHLTVLGVEDADDQPLPAFDATQPPPPVAPSLRVADAPGTVAAPTPRKPRKR